MIYFVEAEGTGRVKIGYAVSVERRLPGLQCGCPHPLRLLRSEEGERQKELQLHKRFASDRIIGEWFNLSPQIKAYIEAGWKSDIREWREGPFDEKVPVLFGLTNGDPWGDQLQYCYLTVICPSCGIDLNHGFEPGADWGNPTHRNSHCRCHPHGYYIAADDKSDAQHDHDPRISLVKNSRKST